MAETSIIIVSYNGLNETTAPCLDSVFQNTPGHNFEVIVVDNNSSDGSAPYLAALGNKEPRLKYILNQTNRGFAGGNNDGIKASAGDYIVLLNSDTQVTPGWLQGLIDPLKKDPAIGMIGPVSNAVGNEQQIFTIGSTRESVLQEGLSWAGMSTGAIFRTEMLGFFCIAARREVIEAVGLLDEEFGIGFYEDDDYCIRVRNAGYELACAEDVFVYHQGSGSFGKADRMTLKSMMRNNRTRLEEKYSIRLAETHPRYKHLELIRLYIDQASKSGMNEQLRYRIANRMALVERLMPKGPVKRWKFKRQIERTKLRLEDFHFRSIGS